MKNSAHRLLVVDDEVGVRDFLCDVTRNLGFDVRAAGSADEFFLALDGFEPTIVMLDLNMPGSDGIELLRELAKRQSPAQILVISGEDSRVINAAERLGSAQGLQMAGVLQKPVMLPELEDLLERLTREAITEAGLHEAIVAGDLLLNYQPKFCQKDDGAWSICGAEALVRWRHAELGIVMPDKFIPLAEETGLIGPLTDFVVQEVLQQKATWAERGMHMNVAVNIAPQLLGDVQFPDRLSRLTNEYGSDGAGLTLEITETGAMTDLDATMDILARLRLKGFQLSIDDFGTGYSSMKQLFCMPFTELKIDRSFVMEIAGNDEAKAMVRTMIQLADNLNMTACAEGVESQEILEFLGRAGCHCVQGFYFSKPLPLDEFEAFVSNWSDDSDSGSIAIGGV